MNIKYWNQPKTANLEAILNEKLKKGFKKVWIISGMTKDSGMELIYESIEKARELGSEVNIMIGIDRKNTSKDMLMRLLKMGCNLFVHINREDNKVETRIYIFENEDGESYVYQSSGKFSEGGLSNNHCLIQEIVYESGDEKAFENFKSVLLQGTEEVFKSVDAEDIKLLAEKGELVVRIIERKIPSISEMYGSTSIDAISNNDMYDEENLSTKLFDIPMNDDFDIDIDIDLSGEVRKSELSVESEAKKSKEEKVNIEKLAAEKLSKFYEDSNEMKEDEKKVQIIKSADEIDFSSAKIFVFELNKMVEKGVGEGEVKIPNYIYESMTEFFGKDLGNITDDKGKARFGVNLKLEVIDVSNNEKFFDEEAIMYDADRYFAIKSPALKSLKPEEGDIVRFIKKGDNEFCVELVRKGIKEFEIWESFCKHTMKNSKRRFGIM